MKHNKFTQNEKLSQVREGSLVIGVDIASEKHYARAFDWRGMELGKVISFENDMRGFIRFATWMNNLKTEHHKKNVVIGMEPTGHYWLSLARNIKQIDVEERNEYKLVIVNTLHVKKSKEISDNSQSKNDKKDAMLIGKLFNTVYTSGEIRRNKSNNGRI